ncbi:MAG: response regulator [Proteobacteria bacterium]|nr:response regulator [Pseudomonadota bacterium]
METRILIVDDEDVVQTLLSRFLREAGYVCRCAGDVASGKRLLSSEKFDLLFCDLNMPGENGLELLKHAKDHYPQMGRIVVTGLESQDIASEVLEIGVYGYIIKPITANVLLITAENALRHLRFDLHLDAYKNDLEQKIFQRTEKLDAIMNSLHIGVVMLSLDMEILEMNKKMRAYFPDAPSGKTTLCYQTFMGVPRDEICEACPMVATFKSGNSVEVLRKIRVTSAQAERCFRIVTSPIFDQNGDIYAGISLYEDITERLAMESNLRQAQKLESVGQLAAGIAHEINSPIQFIGDNLRFLKDTFGDLTKVMEVYEGVWERMGGGVPEELRQQLANTVEEADLAYLKEEIPKTFEQSFDGVQRVEKIVRAMKDFSHPGGDEKTSIDINKTIESTATVCRNEWKYVAKMSLDLDPDLPFLSCFAGEISQVLLNIIVNGAHAISDVTSGGSKGLGEIRIATHKTPSGVQIRVSDTGGGIPEKVRERIFDPFFTTKERGKGTGQGLAIAHRVVVEKHKGTLSFETEMGRGTTFVIDLPNQ